MLLTKTLVLSEIFASIQGEGEDAGTPCVFIRLAGCNLNCPFCDTKYAHAGRAYSAENIVKAALATGLRYAVLTGGEPMIHDLAELVHRLHDEEFYVALETNGTIAVPTGLFNRVTVSPKSDTLVQTRGHEMKLLWGIVPDPEAMRIKYPDFNRYSIQPMSGESVPEIINYLLGHPKWRLSAQVHKLLGLR